MQLHGLHHVTAVTGNASGNVQFYTQVLGLRLVKKTVNQDDTSAYHLFYADKLGSPGTDMTFFDWPHTPPNKPGSDSIANTMFRVSDYEALEYWQQRLDDHNIQHSGIESFAGRDILGFLDPEGQHLSLVDDQGALFEGEPWDGSGVPLEYAIRGFYGVTLSVQRLSQIEPILSLALNFAMIEQHPSPRNESETAYIFAMDNGGPGKEVWVFEQPTLPHASLGRGGVHHVAFRVRDDAEQNAWNDQLRRVGIPSSGVIDRFYFKSLYFRISQGILFELATDGPGFASDEPLETLGEKLALPPFLEPQRERIEANLKPL
jgi:glyoxalase family protein